MRYKSSSLGFASQLVKFRLSSSGAKLNFFEIESLANSLFLNDPVYIEIN